MPGGGAVTARVASSVPLNTASKYWLIGISLDTPGNLWCLGPAPQDWGTYADVPKFFPAAVKYPNAGVTNLETRCNQR